MTTKWKIILKYGLDRTSPREKSATVLANKITTLLKELGLKQMEAGIHKRKKEGTWCSDEVNLEVATEKLPEILGIFANPRSINNSKGELDHLFLYIERL
jgi:hypothetical protein